VVRDADCRVLVVPLDGDEPAAQASTSTSANAR
jgi:hypothetical protein